MTPTGVGENVWHVQGDGAITDLPGLASALQDAVVAWWNAWRTGYASNCTLTKITCRDLGTLGGAVYERDVSIVGTASAGCIAGALTKAVTWRTARSGRSYRGRSYMVGIPTNALADPNNLIEAYRAAFQGNYADLLSRLNAAGSGPFGWGTGRMVVVSRYQLKEQLLVPVTTPITSAQIRNTKLDIQRRRGPGRGA